MFRKLLIFFILISAVGFSQNAPFSINKRIPVGSKPSALAAADFNNDGKFDIAVLSADDQTILILLGDGAGNFQAGPGAPIAISLAATEITAADFNGDGKVDLAYLDYPTNSNDNRVFIRFGLGDGTFLSIPGSVASVPQFANKLVAADLNGDGKVDLIADKHYTTQWEGVRLINDGTGSFTAQNQTATSAIGDFNRDGRLDYAMVDCCHQASVTVRLAKPDGTFTSAIYENLLTPIPGYVGNLQQVGVGDFDHDGLLDLIGYTVGTESFLYGWRGDGAGGFQQSFAVTLSRILYPSYGATKLAVGDFNGDGISDWATLSNRIDVGITHAPGTQQPFTNFVYQAGITDIVVADFNGDGKSDIVTAVNGPNELSVLLSGPPPTSQTLTLLPIVPTTALGNQFPDINIVTFSSSGLLPKSTSDTPNLCLFDTGAVRPIARGVCHITISQSGDSFTQPAQPISQTITITGLTLSISVSPVGTKTVGDPPFNLIINGSTNHRTISSNTPTNCSVVSESVTVLAAGTCTLRIQDDGDSRYEPATFDYSFTISAGSTGGTTQTITFGTMPDQIYDGNRAPFLIPATVNSGLPIKFTAIGASPGPCAIDGLYIVVVSAPGICTITATQMGNSAYAPAAPVTQSFFVALGKPTIMLLNPGTQTLNAGSVAVDVSSDIGLGATLSASPQSVCASTGGPSISLLAVGTCTVTASLTFPYGGYWDPATPVVQSFSVINNRGPSQSINFNQISDTPYSVLRFNVFLTATSGLPVTITSNTPAICLAASGTPSFIDTKGVGTCSITATQPGNATFAAAAPVTRTFQVTQSPQRITFYNLGSSPLGSFEPGGSTSSSLPLTLTASPASVCSSSGNRVLLKAAGYCLVTATQPGDSRYLPAPPITRVITALPAVGQAQTITFAPISNHVYGSSPFQIFVSASSGLPVYLAIDSYGICTYSGNTIAVLAVGTCTIIANQNGNTTYAAAVPVLQSFTITKASQTITFPNPGQQSLSAGSTTITATADSGLPLTFTASPASICTSSSNRITFVAAGSCIATASQSGDSNHEPATPATQTFSITAAPGQAQSIAFAALGNQVLGTAPFPLFATASSGLPVTFTSGPPAICSVSGSTLTLSSVGSCTVTANQTGNQTYSAATPGIQTFSVTAATQQFQSQTITVPSIPDHRTTDAPFSIQATASSGLPVALSVLSGPATINGATVSLTGAGTVTIQATQPGNANYNAAPVVTRSFNVSTTTTTPTGILITRVVNAASYAESQLAPATYAAVFGSGFLSGGSQATVTIRDASGTQTVANQIYTGDAQINFLVPDNIALGAATLIVSNSSTTSAPFSFAINATVPGLFSADSSGAGPAAAQAIVVFTSNGSTAIYTLGACDYSGACVPASIPMNAGTEVYFVLYGTGIRGHLPNGVTATVGGTPVEVQYAGAQGGYPGLDQVNVRVPLSLAKSGVVNIQLTVDGKPANIVSVRLD